MILNVKLEEKDQFIDTLPSISNHTEVGYSSSMTSAYKNQKQFTINAIMNMRSLNCKSAAYRSVFLIAAANNNENVRSYYYSMVL